LPGQGLQPLADFGIGGEGAALGWQAGGVVEDGWVWEPCSHFRAVGQVGQGTGQRCQGRTHNGCCIRCTGRAGHRRWQYHAGLDCRCLRRSARRRHGAHSGAVGSAVRPWWQWSARTTRQQDAGQCQGRERRGPTCPRDQAPGTCGRKGTKKVERAHAWTTVPRRRHMGPGVGGILPAKLRGCYRGAGPDREEGMPCHHHRVVMGQMDKAPSAIKSVAAGALRTGVGCNFLQISSTTATRACRGRAPVLEFQRLKPRGPPRRRPRSAMLSMLVRMGSGWPEPPMPRRACRLRPLWVPRCASGRGGWSSKR
jgi:hypothetical protein